MTLCSLRLRQLCYASVGLILASMPCLPAPKESAGLNKVQISVRPDQERYVLGEPIWITFIITNASDRMVEFEIGCSHKDSFSFCVTNDPERGSKILYPYREGGAYTPRRTLEPSASQSQRLLLNEYIEWTKPGTHHIVCTVTFPIWTDRKPLRDIARTNRIQLLLEENQRALEGIINGLAQDLNSRNGETRRSAIQSLCAIRHERVLAVLKTALKHNDEEVVWWAIRGLGKIENNEARRLLKKVAEERRGTLAGDLATGLLGEPKDMEQVPRE